MVSHPRSLIRAHVRCPPKFGPPVHCPPQLHFSHRKAISHLLLMMWELYSIKKALVELGKNNKPTYAVMAIAVVKGIARPLFTMSDKHADPETKKYTAIREGLTEVVAIPTYFACGELAGKVANKLNLSPEKKALARSNFMFLGVWL